MSELRFRWWKLRVCLLGVRYLHTWVGGHLTDAEWRDAFHDEPDADAYFTEGWCRND